MTLVEEERNIIKVIAIMKLIDDDVKYSSSLNNISLSLNKEPSYVEKIVDSMISKNILKKNLNDNTIDFAVIADDSINELINNIILKKYSEYPLSDLLDKFDKNKYYISNEYNFNNNMVRFYRSIYLEASTLVQLSDLSSLMAGKECDGLLINLINDNRLKVSQIVEVLNRSNLKNIIIRYTDKNFSVMAKERLYSIFAANYLLDSKKEVSDSVKLVLPSYIEDSSTEVNNYLKSIYSEAKCYNFYTLNKNKTSLKECINISLSEIFNKTVIFNNEQVNKNNISSVTSKARNLIIDDILSNNKNDYGTTSQEATIFDSYKASINSSDEVIKLIINWIVSSNGNKICAEELINALIKEPFGMRRGIIPLFIATAVSRISISNKEQFDTVILYNDTQEIEVSANNISKMVSNPKKYYFCFKQISNTKLKITNELLELLDCTSNVSFSDNIICLVQKLKNKVSNLAPIIIKSDIRENILNLSESELKFKDLLLKHDLNNYELLFTLIPEVLGCEYEQMVTYINATFGSFDMKLNSFYEKTIKEVKKKFMYSDTIKSSFDLWYAQHKQIDNIVFETNEKNMYKALKSVEYNDDDAINLLSYSAVNCRLDNWTSKKKELFFRIIDLMISKTENFVEENDVQKSDFNIDINAKLSSIGKTLYSNLLDSIEEYGDSISNEEKAIILKKLMNEIIN